MGTMSIFAMFAAAIFAILGVLHFAYTVHDLTKKPRYFKPKDSALLVAMRQTKTAIAPGGRNYWAGILGFHFSHSIGVLLFALLIWLSTQYQIDWLPPFLVAVGGVYSLLAWRFWFHIPLIFSLAGTLLLMAAWLT
jgi:hypothetical protein